MIVIKLSGSKALANYERKLFYPSQSLRGSVWLVHEV